MTDDLKLSVADAAVASIVPFGVLSMREQAAREVSTRILETLGALGFLTGQLRTANTPQTAVNGYYQDSVIRDIEGVLLACQTVAQDLALRELPGDFSVSGLTRSMAARAIAEASLARIVASGALISFSD